MPDRVQQVVKTSDEPKMRLCRFNNNQLGFVQNATVTDVTAALSILPIFRYPLPENDVLIENLLAVRMEVERLLEADADLPQYALDDVQLLSPIANPGKVIAAPVNYLKHLMQKKV